jgi:hypothetical protein
MSLVVRTVFLEHAFTELPHVLKEYFTVNYRNKQNASPSSGCCYLLAPSNKERERRQLFFVVVGTGFAPLPASS